MTAKMIEINDVSINLDTLLAFLNTNGEVILTRDNVPVARLSPMEATTPPRDYPRIPDLHQGVWMSDDFTAPLSDEFWFGNEES